MQIFLFSFFECSIGKFIFSIFFFLWSSYDFTLSLFSICFFPQRDMETLFTVDRVYMHDNPNHPYVGWSRQESYTTMLIWLSYLIADHQTAH